MSTVGMVVAVAVLVTGAVLFVAWPFASPEREPPEQALSAADRRLLELRDLDQELRTGKITQADYDLERGRLRAEAAAALAELDQLDELR